MTRALMDRPAPEPRGSNRGARRSGLDGRMRTALVFVALTGAVEALGAAAFVHLEAAFSVALGAALAVSNLWILARIVVALLPEVRDGSEQAPSPGRIGWAILAAVKMAGLLAVSWLLMDRGVVEPLSMLIGFLSLPIGIAIGSVVSDRSAPPEDPPA